MARTPLRRTNTCRSSKPRVSFPSSPCLWRRDAGGMRCKKQTKKKPWKGTEVSVTLAEGRMRMRRLGPDLLRAGERALCEQMCGALRPCGSGCPQRQVQPLFRCSPFSRPRLPLPHCSSRKLALKTHPKPPRPSAAGDCYWPQLPPLCLITSIWGCGKM